ncbi:MAG: DUF5107 domain-containing protein [Elusimicrobia bacterium]|nr:DUF5107 domain-containing protein [Elusimicrobiota bacterium]
MLTRETLSGREQWRLDDGRLRVELLPALGARVWTLHDLEHGVQWVWRSPKVPLKAAAPGANYDENWAGGWEELFPNDALGDFDGRALPDHGEWWSRAWTAEEAEQDGRPAVRMTLETRSVPAKCEKIVWLAKDRKAVRVRYRIANAGKTELRFMLKQHLALAIEPGDRLELPGGALRAVNPDFSTRLGSAGPFEWPNGLDKSGRPVDVSAMPPRGRDKEFVYVCDLVDGWAGVRRGERRLRMRFDKTVFPHCWFFMDFGGWNGLYTAVLEPCTQWPKDLNEAAAAGRVAALAPGQTLETEVEVELA